MMGQSSRGSRRPTTGDFQPLERRHELATDAPWMLVGQDDIGPKALHRRGQHGGAHLVELIGPHGQPTSGVAGVADLAETRQAQHVDARRHGERAQVLRPGRDEHRGSGASGTQRRSQGEVASDVAEADAVV